MNKHPRHLDAKMLAQILGGHASGDTITAPGPGHSADDRSMSVKVDPSAPDGLLLHSFASDDWPSLRDHVNEKLGRPAWKPQDAIDQGLPVNQEFKVKPSASVVAEYIYRDADGHPSRKIVRTAEKQFPQYRWTGSGWASGVKEIPLYPYRLPELLAAVHTTVFLCEGEKDVDRLTKEGFVATTNPMGAGKWSPELNRWFGERDCFILADNDEAGRKHADDVARNLSSIARTVCVVDLPDLPDKGDVSDWLNADLENKFRLVDVAKASPTWTERSAAPASLTGASLQSMVFDPVRYVVPGYIAEGLTILAGKPKVGKSWLCLDLACAVSRGGVALGKIDCEAGDVLYAALEDNARRYSAGWSASSRQVDGQSA